MFKLRKIDYIMFGKISSRTNIMFPIKMLGIFTATFINLNTHNYD